MPSNQLPKQSTIGELKRFVKKLPPSKHKKCLNNLLNIELANCNANENSAVIRLPIEKKKAWEEFDKNY